MLSEKYAKLIRSLIHKKYRSEYNLFVAEGRKSILDILGSGFEAIDKIFITSEEWEENHTQWAPWKDKTHIVTSKEINKISNMDSTPTAVMTGNIPPALNRNEINFKAGIHIYLDQIQDPGNMGTILRTATWFGVESIGLSEGCADIVHPKVIQASMGSFCRINYWLGPLTSDLHQTASEVIGADLMGDELYQQQLPLSGLLVIGNEGQGISPSVRSLLNRSIKIPAYGGKTESLNAAIATAVILAEWQRQMHLK